MSCFQLYEQVSCTNFINEFFTEYIPYISTYYLWKDGGNMTDNKEKNVYDDGNIPEVDLPQNSSQNTSCSKNNVEPLPESSRPRKDGPGGE